MKRISIYNNFLQHNQEKREVLIKKLKDIGFDTGKYGDFLFIIGGDGTFLQAVQKNFKTDPIFIGVNTGNLGFLSEFRFSEVDEILRMIQRKEYDIETLPIYEAFVKQDRGHRLLYFLNDITVERKESRIIHSSIHINDEKFCDISGDGLILSSSLGSTGYAASAGGSISLGSQNILQLNPINPVQSRVYKSLSHSVIFKDENEVTVFPSVKKGRKFRIVCDGEEVNVNNVKFLEIRRSKYKARLLRSNRFNEVENLRRKIFDDRP